MIIEQSLCLELGHLSHSSNHGWEGQRSFWARGPGWEQETEAKCKPRAGVQPLDIHIYHLLPKTQGSHYVLAQLCVGLGHGPGKRMVRFLPSCWNLGRFRPCRKPLRTAGDQVLTWHRGRSEGPRSICKSLAQPLAFPPLSQQQCLGQGTILLLSSGCAVAVLLKQAVSVGVGPAAQQAIRALKAHV